MRPMRMVTVNGNAGNLGNAVVQWLDNNQLADRKEYQCYERKSKNVTQKIRGTGKAAVMHRKVNR